MNMSETIHNIAFILVATCLAFLPAKSMAQDVQKPQIETEQNSISVTVTESTLHIKNAEHMVLEVFSITGNKVYTTRIDSSSKNIDLDSLAKGCYIVRIGKYTRKVYLR